MELKTNDYKNILDYYNKPIPKNKDDIQKNAETIINAKLCRCIKKIDPVYESKSIGICTKTIFNNKGYTRGKFKCKKGSFISIKKAKTKAKKKITKKNNKNNKNKSYKK